MINKFEENNMRTLNMRRLSKICQIVHSFETVKTAIKALSKINPNIDNDVIVGLIESNVFVRSITGPNIKKETIQKMLNTLFY